MNYRTLSLLLLEQRDCEGTGGGGLRMASSPLFIFHFYLCLLMYKDRPCSASSLNNNQN